MTRNCVLVCMVLTSVPCFHIATVIVVRYSKHFVIWILCYTLKIIKEIKYVNTTHPGVLVSIWFPKIFLNVEGTQSIMHVLNLKLAVVSLCPIPPKVQWDSQEEIIKKTMKVSYIGNKTRVFDLSLPPTLNYTIFINTWTLKDIPILLNLRCF